MDKKDLEHFDKEKMYLIYDKWPEIAKDAFNYPYQQIDFSKIDHIVFAGMGGSGTIGDIFSAILSKTDTHVTIVRGYTLPKTVNSKTLIVATSISGNTKEILTILESASKIECRIIGFSSGGIMEEFCTNHNIEFRKIEKIHSPRASLVNFLYSILKILKPILPIKDEDILESLEKMDELRNKINSENLSVENKSLDLAKWISGIPLIYYPFGLQSVATRFKNCLQENTNTHAISEDVVESSHNGIVAWEKKSIVQPILLIGQEDYIKTKERWGILREYFNKEKIDFREIVSEEGNILTKIINMIYLLDYTTIYCAVISKTDPSPVESINFIKERL